MWWTVIVVTSKQSLCHVFVSIQNRLWPRYQISLSSVIFFQINNSSRLFCLAFVGPWVRASPPHVLLRVFFIAIGKFWVNIPLLNNSPNFPFCNYFTPNILDIDISKNIAHLTNLRTIFTLNSDHDLICFEIRINHKAEKQAGHFYEYSETNWAKYRRPIDSKINIKNNLHNKRDREIDMTTNAREKTAKRKSINHTKKH